MFFVHFFNRLKDAMHLSSRNAHRIRKKDRKKERKERGENNTEEYNPAVSHELLPINDGWLYQANG